MQISPHVIEGVKLFTQLQALGSLSPLEAKWVRDDEDLRLSLEQLADNLTYTKRLVGKVVYKGQQSFDFVHDVKRALEFTLLIGETERETAGQRRRNLNMYHLVLEPVLEQLGTLTHEEAINVVHEFTSAVYDQACTMDVNMHPDDAVVAKAIVKDMVTVREAARKAEIAAKKKRKRKKKEEDQLIKEIEEIPVDLM